MNLIGIALIIGVVVGAVHMVYKNAFNHGKSIGQEMAKAEGIAIGREQMLKEDILRLKTIDNDYSELNKFLECFDIPEKTC